MTRTWFTSDHHLGHEKIIALSGRPFETVEEMNEVLIERHNAVVRKNDLVWVLGDVAMDKIADTLPLWTRFNGRKILVAGNHDRCFAGAQADPVLRARWVEAYRDKGGFTSVVTGSGWLARPSRGAGIPLLVPRVGGAFGPTVQLSHFPYAGESDKGRDDRYAASRPRPWRRKGEEPVWLVHGHVHERWAVNGAQINVGVDVWGFRPVEDEVVAALVEGGPQ